MSTRNAALHPKILIQQAWWGAQESALPKSFQVMLAWGPHFETTTSFFPHLAISCLSLKLS